MFKRKFFGLSLILLSAVFLFDSLSFADELADIQKAIKEKGAKWAAGKTSMMMLTPEERRMRLGLDFTKGLRAGDEIPYQESFAAVPGGFDWRNIDGNGTSYVTPVRNQGNCGSCWAFAAAAALESYTLMTQNTPNTNLDLAEQILVSCYNPNGCSGGSPSGASAYIKSTGLPGEGCFFYTAFDAQDGSNSVFCSQACSNWQTTPPPYKILNYGSVSATVSAIKDALVNYGPLVTTFSVYADFFSYNGGIYSHVTGVYEGGHAVLIVGYDDNNECFIVKNSWGTGWGESGFFKIAYSELGSPVYFGGSTLTYYGSLSAPTIIVTKPTTGTLWQAGTTQAISWTFTGYPGSSVKIDLKNGSSNSTIISSTSISSAYNWSIPTGLAEGSGYQVVVTSTSNVAVTGISGAFSITAPPPTVPFSVGGTVFNKTQGLSGVTMTFSRVSGTGTIPGSVKTVTGGAFSQTGFVSGTTYKVTPSITGYSFTPKSLTFSDTNMNLEFTGTPKGRK
jgi:Papain family cysteine protease/Kre9/KNH-like N-terminal Ig-like domain